MNSGISLPIDILSNEWTPRDRAFPKWPDHVTTAQSAIFAYKYFEDQSAKGLEKLLLEKETSEKQRRRR